ncbi:MAG: DNA-directed RNA polymerase subunit beta' [Chloroflexota bacterium]|nr:DNA-directed RNA polymerase subunit beta' [Chloroflexota bacterium]
MTTDHEGEQVLDVNDFDAIRISLASPEAIRSWSYGEVTKPETINYRTLKPEHGGLFCERIFGPSRDWECYCGKYKRIRFKGIVCDKCGVEVARSKVRRERMGHIELAAPASHIWYVKGTPSRLGLLLDISPRNLERIIYFAAYLVTEVDAEAKKARVEQLRQELEDELSDIEAELQEGQDEADERLRRRLEELTGRHSGVSQDAAARREQDLEATRTAYDGLRAELEGLLGQAAEREYSYFDRIVVQEGETINEDRLGDLEAAHDERLAAIEAEAEHARGSSQALTEAERDQLLYSVGEESERRTAGVEREKVAARQEYEGRIAALEGLQPLQILTEVQLRELQEDAGGVFKAGMGAEAVYDVVSRMDLDEEALKLRGDIATMTGLKKKKATKRLRVLEALRKGKNRPEWMIFTALPVIPPELRPMVQLDGGRFATSDLNDLYRRVINRNNRLRRLLDLQAPDIIVRNEKRMLQEAVDALIDNGRRGRVVSGSGKHKLKSLSDMLKGKQGRFRQNLLGKRVDYSGRSVIVVGPDLELHQCGLPKRMALELFKPFVMRRLVERGHAHNIKAAKRVVERVDPRVWEVLEEVTQDYLVLLNRAPTLHRLGIQAFEVKLVEGSAIQIHPLVCQAYNADFDGDQMAVHVPLSKAAQEEARGRMLSLKNLLSPSNGDPIITPAQDIVLGCYYMTLPRDGARGEGKSFVDFNEVMLAYESGLLDLQARIKVLQPGAAGVDGADGAGDGGSRLLETTVGRVIFNQEVPEELGFRNVTMARKQLRLLIADCYRKLGPDRTARLADRLKGLGFRYATRGGLSIGIQDLEIPAEKAEILAGADREQEEIERQYRRGLITDDERYQEAVRIWTDARAQVADAVQKGLGRQNPLYMMADSNARGNFNQISQMAGMRGLVLNPLGRVIELPIKSSYREGISVLEYFISTHGARKGLADTALRTADSGYLTRRLVDVAQDVIVTGDDCGTEESLRVPLNPTSAKDRQDPETFDEILASRLRGRVLAQPLTDPGAPAGQGGLIADRNEELTEELVDRLLAMAERPEAAYVRTVMFCESTYGVCRLCYGRNLATGRLVEQGEAVGIVAAQSIGEPGTQLTMRTFHMGGVAHAIDITTGLPRVEEIFEARVPKGQALLSELDGTVRIEADEDKRRLRIVNSEIFAESYPIPANFVPIVRDGEEVAEGQVLAESNVEGADGRVLAAIGGRVSLDGDTIHVRDEQTQEKEYAILANAQILVADGDEVTAGTQLTDGNLDPQEILHIRGRKAVQEYMVDEVQRVYRSQGVNTNDKHIEVIVRQMLRKVTIDEPGDSDFLPGEMIDRFVFAEVNAELLAEGGEPATAQETLLGVTKASLSTESFLSAASFQETTRVLTEAAINGRVDNLRGLKENVIIGKLIPAGSGFNVQKEPKPRRARPDSEETSIDTIDLMSGPEGVGRPSENLVPAGFQSLPLDPTLALGNPSGRNEDE